MGSLRTNAFCGFSEGFKESIYFVIYYLNFNAIVPKREWIYRQYIKLIWINLKTKIYNNYGINVNEINIIIGYDAPK